MGVDIGTRALKLGLMNDSGNLEMVISKPYENQTKHKGNRATQDANEWWKSFNYAFGQMSNFIAPDSIKSICITSTAPSLLMVDDSGNPIGRVHMWDDYRAVEESQSSGALLMPKIKWMKKNSKHYDDCKAIIDPAGWLQHKITGVNSISEQNIERFGGLDMVGLADIEKKLPPQYGLCKVVEKISDDASKETGLSKNTLVVQGCFDTYMAMIGSGVNQTGDIGIILGSSSPMVAVYDWAPHGFVGPFKKSGFAKGVVCNTLTSSGLITDWIISNAISEKPQTADYEFFENKASKISPGSNGLYCIPFFTKSRVDSKQKGAFVGLKLEHKTAHMLRSAYEAISYYHRQNIQSLRKLGFDTHQINISGGGSRSNLLPKILSNVLCQDLYLTHPEATLKGTAMVAATGAGSFKNIHEAMSMISATKITPNWMGYTDNFLAYERISEELRGAVKSYL